MEIFYHNRKSHQPQCSQQPICVDDYGVLVFRGFYSQELIWTDEVIYLGSTLPQNKFCYVDGINGIEARKESVKYFDALDANCNTCKFLKRIPFDKKKLMGMQLGKCLNHPYEPTIKFHPEDFQGMSCWQGRNLEIKKFYS